MDQTISFAVRKNRLLSARIVGIIRVDHTEHILDLVKAISDGGVPTIEISLNTPGALKAIKRVSEKFGNTIMLGAGTITSIKETKQSINAGAEYIVTPISNRKILKYNKRFKIPTCMGAFSPTEIFDAYQAGATFVKVFPANTLGIEFIKNISVPLPTIPLLPTGGVTENNIQDWFKAGAKAVGISTALFKHEDYLDKKFDLITEKAKLLAEKAADAIVKNK